MTNASCGVNSPNKMLNITSVTQKQREEIDLTSRLLAALGHTCVDVEPSDRPDVIVTIDGTRIGIEVTQFHADEHSGAKGSPLRVIEERLSKQSPGQSYTICGVTNPTIALLSRIQDKITASSGYDRTNFDQLWLLISTGLPKLGAVGATFAVPTFVRVEELNQSTHQSLFNSSFSAVYLQMLLPPALFYWARESKWCSISASGG